MYPSFQLFFNSKCTWARKCFKRGFNYFWGFFVILMKVGEARGSHVVRSTAVLQPHQHLSVGFSHLLSQDMACCQMRGATSTLTLNFDYKPNLEGYGCEGPYPTNVPGLHASTAVPCHSLSWYRPLNKSLQLYFGLLNAMSYTSVPQAILPQAFFRCSEHVVFTSHLPGTRSRPIFSITHNLNYFIA